MNISLNNKGITLLELLIVFSILAILTAITIKFIHPSKFEIKKDVFELYSNLEKIKSYAIKYRKIEQVKFNVAQNSYTLIITKNDNSQQTITYNLSQNVEYGDGGHSDTSYHTVKFGAGTTANFFPNGYCMPSGSIFLKLKNSNDVVYKIKVTLAGLIEIYRWNGNSWIK